MKKRLSSFLTGAAAAGAAAAGAAAAGEAVLLEETLVSLSERDHVGESSV